MLLRINVSMQKTVMHIIGVTTLIIPSWHISCRYSHFYRKPRQETAISSFSSTSVRQAAGFYVLMNVWINDILRKIIIIKRYYRIKTWL